MAHVAVWQMTDIGPNKLAPSSLSLEADLEAWIDQDPDLVQFGLTILGRQVRVDAGIIDLLAIDPQGRWCVIEIKRDTVDRNTIAQVLDYAACLNELPEEQLREVLQPHLTDRGLNLDEILRTRDVLDSLDPGHRQIVMYVVGTVRSPGLDRMLRLLSERHGVSLHAKLFNVFETTGGQRVLIRETADGEAQKPIEGSSQPVSLMQVRQVAEAGGLASIFDVLKAAADKHGLYSRVWKRSVMFAPGNDGRRCLFTVWTNPQQGGLQVYVEPKAFAEFFPVEEQKALDLLGSPGYRVMNLDAAQAFAGRLDQLLGDLS